jgi:hypothetical protein
VTVKVGDFVMTIPRGGWDKDPKPPDSETLASKMATCFDLCLEKLGIFEGNFPTEK